MQQEEIQIFVTVTEDFIESKVMATNFIVKSYVCWYKILIEY